MVDGFAAVFIEDDCYDVEAVRAVFDVVLGEEVLGGFGYFQLLFVIDGCFGRSEFFAGATFYLDEDDRRVGIDHNEVKLASRAGVVSGEELKAFSFEKFFTAFFTPAAKLIRIVEQLFSR